MPTSAQKRATKRLRQSDNLIEDFSPFKPTFESVEANAPVDGIIGRIRGYAAKLNMRNDNDRFYGADVISEAVQKIEPGLMEGALLGEVDHPEKRTSQTLKDAAIKYTKLWIENDANDPERPLLAYEADILDNPNGQHLQTLLRAKVKIGISTRGYAKLHRGSVKESGKSIDVDILDAYEFAGIDAVHNPSNKFGRIAHHENEEDFDMDEVTLETLTESKPELVAQIREAAANDAKAELKTAHEQAMAAAKLAAETAQREAVEAAVNEAKVAAKVESDAALATAKTAADAAQSVAVQEAVRVALDEVKPALEAKVTALEASVTELTARAEKAEQEKVAVEATVTTLTEARNALQVKLDVVDAEGRKNARLATIKEACEKAEHAPYAVIMRRMLEADNVELTEQVVTEKAKLANDIWTAMGKPKGVGTTQPSSSVNNIHDPEVKESVGVHAQLAGIEE